jgi:hypothetical protein
MFGGLMKSYRSRQAAPSADRFSGGLPAPAIHIDLSDGFDHDDVVRPHEEQKRTLSEDTAPPEQVTIGRIVSHREVRKPHLWNTLLQIDPE